MALFVLLLSAIKTSDVSAGTYMFPGSGGSGLISDGAIKEARRKMVESDLPIPASVLLRRWAFLLSWFLLYFLRQAVA
jgi:hypothetical protein